MPTEFVQPADPHDAGKYDAYTRTVLHFTGPPPLVLDLRRPLPADATAALRALGLDGPFAVMTAENPEGENAEDADDPGEEAAQARENRRRTHGLVAALDEAGVSWVPVTGTAPDGDYPEHCVAVRLPRERAIELARVERQLALFWFDGSSFWLVPAAVDAMPQPLPAPEARAEAGDAASSGGAAADAPVVAEAPVRGDAAPLADAPLPRPFHPAGDGAASGAP